MEKRRKEYTRISKSKMMQNRWEKNAVELRETTKKENLDGESDCVLVQLFLKRYNNEVEH